MPSSAKVSIGEVPVTFLWRQLLTTITTSHGANMTRLPIVLSKISCSHVAWTCLMNISSLALTIACTSTTKLRISPTPMVAIDSRYLTSYSAAMITASAASVISSNSMIIHSIVTLNETSLTSPTSVSTLTTTTCALYEGSSSVSSTS